MEIQVRTNFRTAITIPEKFWPKFRDTVDDIIGEYQDNKKGSKDEKKSDVIGVSFIPHSQLFVPFSSIMTAPRRGRCYVGH